MPHWIRIWMVTLLVTVALPLNAQESDPREWIDCPASPEERQRQCRRTDDTIRRNTDLLATVGAQIRDPEIILVRVAREAGESLSHYQKRVRQQRGVATPVSNHWLPVRGRYYDPDRQVMYVALARGSYWHYVWETLAPDEELARRTFLDRERSSRQYKQMRFTGPDGRLAQWEREIEQARRFRTQCCQPLPATEAGEAPRLPGNTPRP